MLDKIDGNYKGFDYELVPVDGDKIMLLDYDPDDTFSMIWIEEDMIKSTDEEMLRKYLSNQGYDDILMRVEKFHPCLHHFIVDLTAA